MFRIVTSFNARLYRASGRRLLASVRRHLGNVPVFVYYESADLETADRAIRWRDYPGLCDYGATLIDVLSTRSFRAVWDKQLPRIPRAHGGLTNDPLGANPQWNHRWFQWFRKVAAQHDLISNHPAVRPGYLLWMDSDLRVTARFGAEEIASHIRRPIGIMRGNRRSPETGFIVYDERSRHVAPAIQKVWELYYSGDFASMRNWDDASAYSEIARQAPEVFHDFAEGQAAVTHTNSNGHTTAIQILPLTPFGHWLEHDKGIHKRQGDCDPMAGPLATLRRLTDRLFRSPHRDALGREL